MCVNYLYYTTIQTCNTIIWFAISLRLTVRRYFNESTCGNLFSLSETAESAVFPPTRLLTSAEFFRTSKTSCVVVVDEFANAF